jgi:hypothetical protein
MQMIPRESVLVEFFYQCKGSCVYLVEIGVLP